MHNSLIVIGGNHHNTLGLIRSLGREGVMSSVILHDNSENSYILLSKYITDYSIVRTEEELINSLLSRKEEGGKKVVVTTSDYASSVVDRHRNIIDDFFFLPGCEEQGRLTRLMNKETMAKYAEECGLNIPKSSVLGKDCSCYSDISYPCITKPLASIEGSKADIAICNTPLELMDYLKQSTAQRIQVQQFIKKTQEFQLIGVANHGEILIPGKSRILTQPLTTNTGFLHYEHLDGTEPISQCVAFLKKTGYSGLFSIEFIRDTEGKDFFMEINFRNDGNAICVTEAGTNLPFLWYQLCLNKIDSLFSIPPIDRELFVIPEYTEINLWYEGKISLIRMIREFRQADCGMEYDPNDPAPTNGKFGIIRALILNIAKKPIKDMIRLYKHLGRA